MRAIWKGHIRFSLVTIPVRIYNAVDTDNGMQDVYAVVWSFFHLAILDSFQG